MRASIIQKLFHFQENIVLKLVNQVESMRDRRDIICFQASLATLSIVTFLVLLVPTLLEWKMVNLEKGNSPPVLLALQSNEFQMSLVVSLSISVPMFFELLLRVLSNAKYDSVLPNIGILVTLAIPDFIILIYIRNSSNLYSLNYILKVRFILLTWLVLTFIKSYGGKMWSNIGLVCLFLFVCVGRIATFYKVYVGHGLYDTLNTLGIISDAVAFLVLLLLSFKWYRIVFRCGAVAAVTTQQYLCNIYLTAILLSFSGIYINIYSSPNTLDWYNWSSNELTIHILMYTLFYIIVIVFEKGVLQREMLKTKVIVSNLSRSFI